MKREGGVSVGGVRERERKGGDVKKAPRIDAVCEGLVRSTVKYIVGQSEDSGALSDCNICLLSTLCLNSGLGKKQERDA